MSTAVLVSGHNARGSLALAATLSVEAARATGAGVLLAKVGPSQARRPTTLLASPAARELESALRAGGHQASARGYLCHLGVQPDAAALAELGGAAQAADTRLLVVHLRPGLWPEGLDAEALEPAAGCCSSSCRGSGRGGARRGRASGTRLPREGGARPPPALAARRALAGVRAGAAVSRRMGRVARALLGEAGQALPAVLGRPRRCAVGLVLVAIGGAFTGGARGQSAADLAALSAARSMRDALPGCWPRRACPMAPATPATCPAPAI